MKKGILPTHNALAFVTSAKPMWQSSLLLIIVTLSCIPFLDFELAHTSPFAELQNMLLGIIHPNFLIEGLVEALAHTVAFALQAVFISAFIGIVFAQIYHIPGVRQLMAALRSVHELFWALMLIQLFGLSTLTGLLALAIPYSATFARVFAEIQQETPKLMYRQLSGQHLSRLLYSTLPLAWPRFASYFRYRLECALRASVVLGFIGLPTLGYQLDGFLKLGHYSEVAALIFVFIGLVLTMRLWTNRFVFTALLVASFIWFPPEIHWQSQNWNQFIIDITPAPLKENGDVQTLWHWFVALWQTQIVPGIGYTLLLGQFALALSAFLALIGFPLVSKHTVKTKLFRQFGNLFLTTIRSLPELLLTFIALILLGPSLIPGILALGLHNGSILAHLVGKHSNELRLRSDSSLVSGSRSGFPFRVNIYFFELLPRIYGQFLAFTLYRGETILRETAILGILGIPTLGFYIDSAFEEFRLDRAMLLILASALINILAEVIATRCRKHLRINNQHINSTTISLENIRK